VADPGHIFVVRSDLTQLACDALLVPTDEALSVSQAWQTLVGDVPEPHGDWPDRTLLHSGGDEHVRARQVWLVATSELPGRGSTSAQIESALQLMLERVETFVATAASTVRAAGGSVERARPLLALPIVGTGEGGLRARPGAVISRLLPHLDDVASRHEVDVAVVAHSVEHEALCRHWRRRLWASDEHDGEGYAERVLSRWCRGEVDGERVRVEPATPALRELRDRAHRGGVVPFFGSGVSRASGAPAWSAMLEELSPDGAVELFHDLSEHDEVQMADPFARAQVIANLDPGGGQALRHKLRERLAMEHLSLLHVLLANLGARDAITTNYDLGYERACEAGGLDVSIVPQPGGDQRLVKLHGSLGREGGPPLLTRDQLLDFQTERGPLAGVLQMLLLTGHLLFVGYSMSDPSLHAAFHAVRRALESDVPEGGEGRATMATSLQIDPSPALAALWAGTVDVLWPRSEAYPSTMDRTRQKEILLDVLADAASHSFIPLLAMHDDAAELDLTADEQELRTAVLALAQAYRRQQPRSALWDPVEELLERYHWPR
jgi:hypothetical protein